MVHFGNLPSRPKREDAPYNPYDLLNLIVNGKPTQARPYEFDSSPRDANTVLNADGEPVRPIKAMAPCPECGGGLDVPLPIPCPNPHTLHCTDIAECRLHKRPPELPAMIDPFRNPFLEGIMATADVDVDLVSALEIRQVEGTVADRIGKSVGGTAETKASEEEP